MLNERESQRLPLTKGENEEYFGDFLLTFASPLHLPYLRLRLKPLVEQPASHPPGLLCPRTTQQQLLLLPSSGPIVRK